MNQLSQAQALSTGADLWICPDYNYISKFESQWPAFLDWQLNFALSKYHTQKKQILSGELLDILNETQLPLVHNASSPKPYILIPCENLLSTRWCLFFSIQADELSKILIDIKKDLNIKTLRIFAPSNWSKDDVFQFSTLTDLQVVPS
jgi:hypothetical protein